MNLYEPTKAREVPVKNKRMGGPASQACHKWFPKHCCSLRELWLGYEHQEARGVKCWKREAQFGPWAREFRPLLRGRDAVARRRY